MKGVSASLREAGTPVIHQLIFTAVGIREADPIGFNFAVVFASAFLSGHQMEEQYFLSSVLLRFVSHQNLAKKFYEDLPHTQNLNLIDIQNYNLFDNIKRPRRILLDSYNPP
ncbi:hypothetical protein TNCV_4779621 [Trichonephila clavipes]|nr:hypothetical protein TNCV_4779621 [Trichonephila clavipes]